MTLTGSTALRVRVVPAVLSSGRRRRTCPGGAGPTALQPAAALRHPWAIGMQLPPAFFGRETAGGAHPGRNWAAGGRLFRRLTPVTSHLLAGLAPPAAAPRRVACRLCGAGP